MTGLADTDDGAGDRKVRYTSGASEISNVMPAIGFLTRRDDDTYVGELSTLTVQSPLELVHNTSKTAEQDPDYVVMAKDVELGFGWKRTSDSNKEYVRVSIATPEFGCKPLIANLGRVLGDSENNFAIIWNPDQ